jgi:hypothetical protein
MVAPIDSAWSNNVLSDSTLNQTTYGQGTSFPSTWSLTRLFWRTDEQKIYQNTGTEASPTWTSLSAEPPSVEQYILAHDTTLGNYSTPSGATSSSNATVDIGFENQFATNSMSTTNGGFVNKVIGTSATLSPSQTATSFSFSTTSQNWSSGACFCEYSNDGGSTWTEFARLTSNGTDSGNVTWQFNKIRIVGYRGWYVYTAYYDPIVTVYYSDDVEAIHVFSGTQGTDWGEYWKSNQETNAWIYVDMGSSTLTSQVAIYHNSTDTTETQYQIQTSDSTSDNSFVTRRTINVSDLTNDSWNYIRMNPVSCRYVRVRGSSGNSAVMSIDELKVKKDIDVTTADNNLNHGHLTLSTTDTTVGFDGL